jgi:hypothetical protein
VQSAGRVGSRLDKVSELTIIVPLAPGGADRLRAFLRLFGGNLAGADAVGTVHDMPFVFLDNDTRLLFATAYDASTASAPIQPTMLRYRPELYFGNNSQGDGNEHNRGLQHQRREREGRPGGARTLAQRTS